VLQMEKVSEDIWIGDRDDCIKARTNNLPTIHACRTCFNKVKIKESETDLYIDIADMPEHDNVYLFRQVTKVVSWATGKKDLLIHCDEGINRSQFFAMLVLFHFGNYADAWKIWKSREKNVLRLRK